MVVKQVLVTKNHHKSVAFIVTKTILNPIKATIRCVTTIDDAFYIVF